MRARTPEITDDNGSFAADQPGSKQTVGVLLTDNKKHADVFRTNELSKLIDSSYIRQTEVRERVLDGLQIWSDVFQDLLHLRVARTRDPRHKTVALEHLDEELGHNANLRKQRGADEKPISDEQLTSAMAWFDFQMLHGSDVTKSMLMHIVLETAGEIFHQNAAPAFADMPHFREHGEHDADHVEMGIELLTDASPLELEDLRATMTEGWRRITIIFDRIAAIAAAEAHTADRPTAR
ncbi:hypothetical protein [Nocardia arthritidis]|uniref:Iron-containing redox enzyme family protein n=1 Tax=Nocardia arthritidis TaxID=228602 RepID=A0A6G9YLK3_9NOCA|nr:hypothetical protein [Nocardia arthritidis]QIS14020.1 hypothetical protein F5544_30885 [Nocardia arthritidis]